jgi:hypothetical protein
MSATSGPRRSRLRSDRASAGSNHSARTRRARLRSPASTDSLQQFAHWQPAIGASFYGRQGQCAIIAKSVLSPLGYRAGNQPLAGSAHAVAISAGLCYAAAAESDGSTVGARCAGGGPPSSPRLHAATACRLHQPAEALVSLGIARTLVFVAGRYSAAAMLLPICVAPCPQAPISVRAPVNWPLVEPLAWPGLLAASL